MSTVTYSPNDRLWSVLCHLSFFVTAGLTLFIFPLIIYLVMKPEAPYVVHHAREALNFHLTVLLVFLICIPLTVIGIGILGFCVVGIVGLVLSIVAAAHAYKGTYYEYPLSIRFVRQ